MATHTFTVTEMHLLVARTHSGIDTDDLGAVLSDLVKRSDGMGIFEVTAVPNTKCWCGESATVINEATDASDEHVACTHHVKDGYRLIGETVLV